MNRKQLIQFIKKYESIVSYLFFGVCTTLVNVAAYGLFSKMWKFGTVGATSAAWFLAVLFAYVSNRKWVFKSTAHTTGAIAKELFSFFLCRVLTGVLDIAIMYIFVDKLHFNGMFIKLGSNVLVVIANYVASRLVIFKNS